MKKALLYVACVFGLVLQAQNQQSKDILFTGAGAKDTIVHTSEKTLRLKLQVGGAFLFNSKTTEKTKTTVAFPYSIKFKPQTFLEDGYVISKGFYGDVVKLNWTIKANIDQIKDVTISRKEMGSTTPEVVIANVAKDVFEYEDRLTESGVLYQYKIMANFISKNENPKELQDYVVGVGFRNPAATVSGRISFQGGTPVENVTVYAEAVGANITTAGKSMYFKNSSAATGALRSNIKAANLTLQTWTNLTKSNTAANILTYKSTSGDNYAVFAAHTTTHRIQFKVLKNNIAIANLELSNFLPTGEVDAFGKDIYKSIEDISTEEFIHFSAVLEQGKFAAIYINGRLINTTTVAEANIIGSEEKPTLTAFNFTTYASRQGEEIYKIDLCLSCTEDTYLDEVRIWEKALTSTELKRDYRRYLDGSEKGLKFYLRGDEGSGDYLYDLSKKGYIFNENHALILKQEGTFTFSTKVPNRRQLGVFGVTDTNGSYTIASIPYVGNGESFEITPSLGVHQFNPATQSLFLGKDEPVVNKVDFTDVSSFAFKGRVVYNVQNVFKHTDSIVDATNIRDAENYNQYWYGEERVNKGQYYYEGGVKDSLTGFYKEGVLRKYPVIGVAGAYISIDGNVVFDEDNQPVVSDSKGRFNIQVPIGNHKIEVIKNGHTYALNGRFPETGTFEFFEDQTEERYFIDTTRVTLVGKVVGGKIQSDKPVGFGFAGEKKYTNDEGLATQNEETISSVNNIGVAQIIFKGDVSTNELNKTITTNTKTGEYRVDLIPYLYFIKNSDLTIPKNDAVKILTATETVDLREVPVLKSSEFTAKDGSKHTSEEYHYEKSFRFNSDITLTFLNQTFEKSVTIGDYTFDISELPFPIYKQFNEYEMVFEVSQNYVNKDEDQEVVTKEFFTEGALNITNNLADKKTEQVVMQKNNTEYKYVFTAGNPNTNQSEGYKKGITVQYVIDGQNPLEIDNLSDFKSEGIVKGIDKTTGKNFVTVAPEIPDIILRDPPGSNSFASIEAGTTISVEKTNTTNLSNSISSVLHFDLGSSQEIITGVGSIAAFVATTKTIEVISNTDLSLSMTNQQVKENTSVASYTFNQTISTSSDPDYVGADGDLYIGNAKNSFYGVSDDLILSDTIPVDNNKNVLAHIKYTVPVSETETKDLYISKVESFIIGSQPTQTFFMYSQKHLLETLIPNLETLAASLENGETPEPGKEYQSPEFYKQQAKSWRAIIQNNEKDKYNALNNKEALKSSALAKVEKMFSGAQLELDNLINGSGTQKALKNLIQASFFSNKSFDAGMGELTNTIETANLGGNSLTFALDISAGAGTTVGGSLLGAGNTLTTTTTSNSVVSANSNVSSESNTKFSYTLKDNDKDNVLSVDVVNLFDGNGPIFVTQGGATSCPYEGETSSVFYNPSGYNSNTIGNGGVPFSVATNKVYKSDIQVDKSLRTNVPESEAAVFTLLLKNTSETQSDLEFILDVDPISLNGAKTNLKTNGLSIILPFNETVSFPLEISKTPSSSTYKYEDIKIMLYSPCTDPEERTENAINITAEFKKSCSNVEISVPLNNWIFNYNEAYSVDNLGNTSINKLPITFTDFNTEFTGFQKIELQYRNATSSSWIKFATYYGSDALRAAANDKDKGIVIKSSDAEFTHNWDVVRDDIPDGNYEFRAVSYCTDDIVNTSAIVSGTININAPVLFGTPSPKDGILDVGEDILVRFNEDVLKRITSDIVAKGLKNQQEINHDVSVRLDGATNQIELPNQRLSNQSFTLQFWYKKGATSNGTLVSQQDGIQIALNNNTINFAIGGESITGSMNELNYNFYSFIYDHSSSPSLTILRNGDILATKSLSEKLDINTNTSIFIGGRGVEGNIHDIRLWSQSFTQAKATVAKDLTLTGRELNLQGYWRLDEGNGKKALDKAKRKNGIVNLNWDIFPKGNGYEFKNNSYLSLESVGFIQPSHLEDISLSFWIKPENTTPGTIFSNGVGDTSEAVMTNGYRNKWSFEYTSNGQLALHTEGEVYLLTSEALPVNTWSHVGVSLKRGGYLTTFIDGEEVNAVSANKIGGFSGNRILIGAKLDQTSGSEIATNPFTGKLDEIRFWNTARTQTLIARDRYFEINKGSPGLLLYVDFNKDGTNTTKGPTYHHADKNLTIGSTFSVMKGTSLQMYVDDSPAIKPPLTFTNIPLNTVINGDEMIIQPDLTEEEWSLFEGEVIRFSVERLTDVYFNRQLSPVTWTALVNKQELAWYTPTQSKEIVAQKNVGDTYSFVMDVVNIGGSNQPFTIEGIPIWLTATETTGSVKPNTNRQITFTVDKNLAMGNYSADIFLKTASGYNDRLSFDLRVLSNAPDWSVNPRDYNYSMNIIGKIKIDGTFSRDQYTKIGAFINGQPKGEAYLEYDAFYDSYFVYLTIYNENSVNDNPTFKIWDAVNGKIINSFIDTETSISFVQNMVLGSSSAPKIFSNSAITEQNVTLNKGWSWLSFYAKDANFSSLDEAFKNMELTEKDAIKSQLTFANYEDGLWNGNLTSLSVDKMYKVKLSKENNLRVMGEEIDPKTFSVNINKGWNWLPFPIHRNISLQEAMAFYEPSNGDVIKDQFTFAIYDQNAGWRGTLDYLESGNGYMIKSNTAQTLYYPDSKIYQKGAQAEKATATASTNNNLFRGYSSTMSIIATVEADIDFDEVRIYDVNNELRGVSDIVDIAGIKYSFITAFSNRSETLRFVLSSNSTEIDISRTFNFIDNNVLGSFSDPIVLTPVTLSDESSVINEISLYPNPFLDEITINFSSQNGSESKIEVFNVIGKLLLSQTTKTQQKFVINTAKLASGMYVVRITTDDGRIISKKIIKR